MPARSCASAPPSASCVASRTLSSPCIGSPPWMPRTEWCRPPVSLNGRPCSTTASRKPPSVASSGHGHVGVDPVRNLAVTSCCSSTAAAMSSRPRAWSSPRPTSTTTGIPASRTCRHSGDQPSSAAVTSTRSSSRSEVRASTRGRAGLPGRTTRLTSSGAWAVRGSVAAKAASSPADAAGTSSGPMWTAYGPVRRSRCSRTASSSGASPGGKTAASLTRRSKRGANGVLDMTGSVLHCCNSDTQASAHRTRSTERPSPMAHYQSVGSIPPKRHTQHRRPGTGSAPGELYYEELMGEEGFSSDSSLLYHRNIPSTTVGSAVWEVPDQSTTPNHPLTPRHLKLHDLFDAASVEGTDVVTGRRLVLGNGDVRISYAVAGAPSPWYRNGIGDECVYVERGKARVETVFGAFDVAEGDYLVIPRATTHRWIPKRSTKDPLRAYCIEANSHITPPKRYLSKYGQFLEHAPYCERDLRGPVEPMLESGADIEIYVKHRGEGPGGLTGTIHVVPEHPFDVVGWDGCLYPYAFNVADFEPITGRVHQPPPVHQVFEGANFVICNFVPRKVDYHPLAVPVPYYHSNVDSDEVMFYVDGDYEARKGSGIGQGSVSLHPGGHSHGPQPGAYERSIGVEFFDELAVMVDTFRPLRLGEGARASDDGRYAWTWSGRGPEGR